MHVCVTVRKFAILAQASQARLGEISKESSLCLSERLAQAESFGLRRQAISLRRMCLA